MFKISQKTLNLPAGYDPLCPQCWEREMAQRLRASARRRELAGEGVLRRSSWSSLAIVSGSEGNESLLEKWGAGENETGDWRELIGEFRESLEKITEGFAESEEFRGVQRCPEMSCMPWFQHQRGAKTGAGQRPSLSGNQKLCSVLAWQCRKV